MKMKRALNEIVYDQILQCFILINEKNESLPFSWNWKSLCFLHINHSFFNTFILFTVIFQYICNPFLHPSHCFPNTFATYSFTCFF